MTTMIRTSRRGVLALALGAVALPALAQPLPARVRVLRGAGEGAVLFAGIEIALDPGWKTYWRVPGDSGIPPRFDFAGSSNLAAAEVLYPAPQRLSDGYGEILGYSESVVFPLRVRPADPGRPVGLAVTIDFGVCERLCLPVHTRLSATLGSVSAPAEEGARIARSLARVPRAVAAGSAVRELSFDRNERSLGVVAALPSGTIEHVIVEAGRDPPLPLPRLTPLGDGRVRAELRVDEPAPREILVTVVGAADAVEERRSLDG